MAQLTIQPSINDTRSQSLLALIERLGALDLTPILVDRLDSTPDSALIAMAWQFDMLAPEWQVGAASTTESIDALTNIDALTDIDTLSSSQGSASADAISSDAASLRTLLKAAIPLHQTRGTPYAIRTALAALGWSSATLLEGQSSWGGTAYPSSQGWAVFRVGINLTAGQVVGSGDASRAVAAINFFKPARSKLDAIWFSAAPIVDTAPVPTDFVRSIFLQTDMAPAAKDFVSAPGWQPADRKQIAPVHNGHFFYTGISYGASEPTVADSGLVVNGIPIAAAE